MGDDDEPPVTALAIASIVFLALSTKCDFVTRSGGICKESGDKSGHNLPVDGHPVAVEDRHRQKPAIPAGITDFEIPCI